MSGTRQMGDRAALLQPPEMGDRAAPGNAWHTYRVFYTHHEETTEKATDESEPRCFDQRVDPSLETQFMQFYIEDIVTV